MDASALWVLVGLVALQRFAELIYARRNTARLLAQGGVEIGAGHYPLIVLLHAAWLATLLIVVPEEAAIRWPFLVLYLGLQVLRVWTLASLGRFWTTRIITFPTAPLTRAGPYRFCRHPNYLIVAGEIAVLP
ncbi:MAG: isoprenylcysteine carboxylmethyltransferase family protein, partial [Proteobacteria bacterium]|nr:isoprenylcysteine carboxylmethyltransferase family protein [Pseudomonadota bacterium]